MGLTSKKLLILGASFFFAAPVIYAVFTIFLGVYQFLVISNGGRLDAASTARSEISDLVGLMIFCFIMGFTGCLLLFAGLVRYVIKRD